MSQKEMPAGGSIEEAPSAGIVLVSFLYGGPFTPVGFQSS